MSATMEATSPTPVRVQQSLIPELERFGAVDVSACFNCGNCTAVCPLSTQEGAFPRRLIRYAQVGMRDRLLASPEIWSCYACGECTQTCPRDADPAGFMAAARRFVTASHDRTGLTRRLATSVPFAAAFITVLVALFGAFMYTAHRPVAGQEIALFEYLPATFVHNLGIVVLGIFAIAAIGGLVSCCRHLSRVRPMPEEHHRSARRAGEAVWYAVGRESIAQERMRQECADDPDVEPRAWYLRRWFIHASTMWGFLGLLMATILDYLLDLTGVKATGGHVPLWYPVRVLGTVAGLLLVYGTSVSIVRRFHRRERSMAHSSISDWWFLWLLWVAGVSGFALEMALYLPHAPIWGYPMFLFHVAVSMTLVVLAPFGKFAHAIYRPVA
ncbi:MAG TPA: 4Fe-4S dicluster domain-containing protein, partial [Actinomycetota bacterium]|nr:4Fe-4S dicluster domain-containing protein [Actinomycetota bacterium]